MTVNACHGQEYKQSALLVPVPEVESLVRPWRQRHDPAEQLGVPAHVTLLYPFLPPWQIDMTVLAQLHTLFAATPSFRFTLTTVARFPDALYLAPEPADPFIDLTNALTTLYPETPPYGGVHPTVIPHLTIAHSHDQQILGHIADVLAPVVPVGAVTHDVWLMEQSQDGYWHTLHRFALGAAVGVS